MAGQQMSLRNRWLGSAALGFVGWALAAFFLWGRWAELLVLAGPLLAAPLALRLACRREADGSYATAWRTASWLQLPAALLVAGSYWLPAGGYAGALSLPWVIVAFLAARMGLMGLARRGREPTHELALDLGLAMLAVGSVWLACSRAGTGPMGFGEPIVLLTAGHFHFAGLSLLVLIGAAARRCPGLLAKLATWGVAGGVGLVALGITVNHRWPDLALVELVASWALVLACLPAAGLQLLAAGQVRRRPVGLLLVSSALCLVVGVLLAAVYSLGAYLGAGWLTIPVMVQTHAVLNVAGFALPGLAAWSLVEQPPIRDGNG